MAQKTIVKQTGIFLNGPNEFGPDLIRVTIEVYFEGFPPKWRSTNYLLWDEYRRLRLYWINDNSITFEETRIMRKYMEK